MSDRDSRSSFQNCARSVNRELLLRRSDEILGGGSDRVVMSWESDGSEDREGDHSDDEVPSAKERFTLVLVVTVVLRSSRCLLVALCARCRFEENSRKNDGSSSESGRKGELEIEEED